jgi:hypothetical protein
MATLNDHLAGQAPVAVTEPYYPNFSNSFSWRSSLTLSFGIALVWLIARLALLHALGFPDPKVHDEFNYILGADTFAHGRLTNPPHALPEFFASPHTIYAPTYSSKYPPGQSLFLAAGQVLFGHPFYGVIIEGALMIFLLCLALCLWTSFWPAAIASLALAFFFQPPMYWVDSYWGGCAAACGAALLLIAIGWYRRSGNPFSGAIFAAGGVFLFITRPFEGSLNLLAALFLLLFSPLIPSTFRRARKLMAAAAYGVPVAVVGIAAVMVQNFAVTGHPLELPRQVYDGAYMVAPLFTFQSYRHPDPPYPNARIEAEHGSNGWEVYAIREGVGAMQHGFIGRLITPVRFMFEFLPQVPLVLLGLALLDRRLWFCFGLLAGGVLASSLMQYQYPHYIAPSVPALVLIWGISIQCTLPLRTRKIPVGVIAVGVVFLAAVTPAIGAIARSHRDLQIKQSAWPHQRAEMIRRLSAEGKPSLVIVRYPTPTWDIGSEWVYNGADIDRQPVVLAHDLGTDKNKDLLKYYPDRTVWLLTIDANNPDKYSLSPYPR